MVRREPLPLSLRLQGSPCPACLPLVPLPSCPAVERSPVLGQDYSQRTRDLFNHYYPIEVSDIPDSEKEQAMITWWTEVQAACLQAH